LYFIDREPRFLDITLGNLKALGLDGVNLHPLLGTTYDADVARRISESLDLIFLDSDHSYQGAARELKMYLPKLSAGGMLAIHDSILWPGVRKAVAEVAAERDVLTFGTSRAAGLSVIMPATSESRR
jgi:predicted O-methyltransferase YrrM